VIDILEVSHTEEEDVAMEVQNKGNVS